MKATVADAAFIEAEKEYFKHVNRLAKERFNEDFSFADTRRAVMIKMINDVIYTDEKIQKDKEVEAMVACVVEITKPFALKVALDNVGKALEQLQKESNEGLH